MKKALFVTAKDWNSEDKLSLEKKVNEQNYRWKAEILQNNEKKYAYFYSKVDLEILAIQERFTILKAEKLLNGKKLVEVKKSHQQISRQRRAASD